MKSGGGGRKKGDGDGMVSAGTQMLEAQGPVSGETQKENMHVEAGEEEAETVAGDGHGTLPGEEEEQNDEGGEDTDGEEEEEEGEEERPRLEDGFYEIEDIRKKRMRKGQLQYLIKWWVFLLPPSILPANFAQLPRFFNRSEPANRFFFFLSCCWCSTPILCPLPVSASAIFWSSGEAGQRPPTLGNPSIM